MLPDFRFVIGAVLATGLLAVTGLGLFAAVRIAHHTSAGPLEASRSVAFDDRADWNQFQDPDATRRFEDVIRKQTVAAAGPATIEAPATTTPPLAAPDSAPIAAAATKPPEVAEPVVAAGADEP